MHRAEPLEYLQGGRLHKKFSPKNCDTSAPLKIEIFRLSGQQLKHLIRVVFRTRVTAGECKRNRLSQKRMNQTTVFRFFFYSLGLLIDRKHRQLTLLYKFLEKIPRVTAQFGRW